MTKYLFIFSFLFLFSFSNEKNIEEKDYEIYHQQVIKAEQLMVIGDFSEALIIHDQLVQAYEFVFLKEYRVAAQLALHDKDLEKALVYVRKGMLAGWELKSIKNNEYLLPLLDSREFKSLENEYSVLHETYEAKLNKDISERVKKMFAKDQKMALKSLLKIGPKAKERYYENKFAPHSEAQLAEFQEISKSFGYPGEKLIGNDLWMSIILSHHNSISTAYNQKDTLYPKIKPFLMRALRSGEMSPYEFALIDDWYRTVKFNRMEPTYGILDAPSESNISDTDKLRSMVYLRPFDLRNELVKVEEATGMNFYLSDLWY